MRSQTVDKVLNNVSKPQWQTVTTYEYPKYKQDDSCAYKFGDVLYYRSPCVAGLKTKCVFIRYENGKAVVMFESAEFAARVQLTYLERCYS